MRRAKIVATLGPATSTVKRMEELINAGVNVARFNMSHGDHAEHEERLAETRKAMENTGKLVSLLADLQGPKIRLGNFEADRVDLVAGQLFTITIDDVAGNAEVASTTYQGLPQDVRPGDDILVDDGRVRLEAVEITERTVVTRVVVPGTVSNHKGINLPGVSVNVPALSSKDEDDLRWALHNDFDFIALSFVRNASDIHRVHEIMTEENKCLPVIAKIEKPQAVENIDEIIHAFDGLMVARGDLGVELPLEDVPMVQKTVIAKARRWAKPVIVATQMLESMIVAPRPTRAEASDVANAILDGADAVMLSGETSIGAYPIETVRTMASIIEKTEEKGIRKISKVKWDPHTYGGVIAMSAAVAGRQIGADFLVACTQSGDTARRLSRLRSEIPLMVFTPSEEAAKRLTLVWGTTVFSMPSYADTDQMVRIVNDELLRSGQAKPGDAVVIVYGSPIGVHGNTNSMRLHRLGDADGDGEISDVELRRPGLVRSVDDGIAPLAGIQ